MHSNILKNNNELKKCLSPDSSLEAGTAVALQPFHSAKCVWALVCVGPGKPLDIYF